jgi:hypothetical protein
MNFDDFPLREALTREKPPGRRKGFVIPQPAESHEAGWISLEVSI